MSAVLNSNKKSDYVIADLSLLVGAGKKLA